jgi:hypothetical protein
MHDKTNEKRMEGCKESFKKQGLVEFELKQRIIIKIKRTKKINLQNKIY